jgi:transposase
MYRALPSIVENAETLRTRLRQTGDAEQKRRLHLLVLIAEGQVTTRQQAADYFAVHRNTVGRWLARYAHGGLEALLTVAVGGAPAEQRTLSPAAFAALQARLQDPTGFGSYGEVRQWLIAEWGATVPYAQVHRLVHRRLKAKLKRPRPQHPKKT